LFCVALVACSGSPEEKEDAQASSAVTEAASSPFTIGWTPVGFEAVSAGAGGSPQLWGDDKAGSDEPFAVLAPDGVDDPDRDDVVLVSAAGSAGLTWGPGQAAISFCCFEGADRYRAEAFEVDGRPAVFSAPNAGAGTTGWDFAEVVVARAGDVVLRARGVGRSREELLAVLAATEVPSAHGTAPTVVAPKGWRLLGTAGAELAIASRALVGSIAGGGSPPGPPSAHVISYTSADRSLLVMTIPGLAVDVPALVGYRLLTDRSGAQQRIAHGRHGALVLETVPSCPYCTRDRMLLAPTAWGDVAVVVSNGPEPLPVEDLARLAASVEQADQPAWDAMVSISNH
jgi:hypothetical protein